VAARVKKHSNKKTPKGRRLKSIMDPDSSV